VTNFDPQSLGRRERRSLQRAGQLDERGNAVRTASSGPRGPKPQVSKKPLPKRTVSFFKECASELRKVTWPTRAETKQYSMVTFFTLAFMIVFVFGLDFAFSKMSIWLFK
jgi:preprotein translocase subunit SecE